MKDWFDRWRERRLLWLISNLPRELVYWCAVRAITEGCTGSPGEQKCSDVMKRWKAQTEKLALARKEKSGGTAAR